MRQQVVKILRAYEYTYYRIYDWLGRTFGDKWGVEHSADFSVGVLIMFNLFTISFLLDEIGYIDLDLVKENIVLLCVIFIVIIEVIHHFLFKREERFLDIVVRYKQEAAASRRIGTYLVLAYIIGTFAFFVSSLIVNTT